MLHKSCVELVRNRMIWGCVAGEVSLSCSLCALCPTLISPGTADTPEKPVLLNNITDAEDFISGAEVVVVGFFQVRSQHLLSTSCEPYPTLRRARGWIWHKHLPKAASLLKGAVAVTGMWRSERGCKEFNLCAEREMEQGKKVKEAVGVLLQEKRRCCGEAKQECGWQRNSVGDK